MLKRQRPSSPPPFAFVPSIPLVDDSYLDATRDVKRRRILQHFRDGKSGGWAISDTPDDNYDEEHNLHNTRTKPYDDTGLACAMDSADYKQANTVLHELHTLHQHRLLFASADDSGSRCLPQYAQSIRDDVPSKMITAQHPEVPGCDHNHPSSTHPKFHLSAELKRVTQRYGDTNRLLGSLFLSRRRQLGNSEETR